MHPSYDFEKKLLSQDYSFICGVDEVGRGSLAGPLCVAAVILDPKYFQDNKELHLLYNIRDSKLLTKKNREHYYDKIFSASLSVAISIIPSFIIDKINIRQSVLLAMKSAIFSLSLKADHALIDGREIPPNLNIPAAAIIKGDQKCLSIAAASVVAKVTRDRMMENLGKFYPSFGFEKNVGYGTQRHREAIKNIGIIQKIHRLTFGSVKDYVQKN